MDENVAAADFAEDNAPGHLVQKKNQAEAEMVISGQKPTQQV